MPYDKAYQDERRRVAKAEVARIRAATVCANCGAQPIDWHRTEHEAQPNRRIGRMVSAPYSLHLILAEIALCTPLCRSCHMKLDGRLQDFVEAGEEWRRQPRPVVYCSECGAEARPSRRGLCGRCYERLGRAGELPGVNT